MNLLPLFQEPSPLFPAYAGTIAYQPGQFPTAERVWARTLKLPVWHREDDLPLAVRYVEAIRKVASHAHTLRRTSV